MTKLTTQKWRIGDVLGRNTYDSGFVVGTITAYVDTFGGSGYKLATGDGRFFFGDDNSLLVQCSYGGGGDPANQCDEFVRASDGLYCPKHQKIVDEMEKASTKLDALEYTENNDEGIQHG